MEHQPNKVFDPCHLIAQRMRQSEKEEKEANEQTLLQCLEQLLTPDQLEMIHQLKARTDTAEANAEAAVAKMEAAEAKVEAKALEQEKQKQNPITTFVVEDNEPVVHTDHLGRDGLLRPRLLCKACQSGKTGEALADWVIEQSRTNVASSTEVRKIAFFVCDNSLLLTKQTEIRAKSDDIDIRGDIIIISCKESIKCVDKLYTAIIRNPNISTILCCGNARRLKDISELSGLLKNLAKKYELSVYVDEADKILHSPTASQQVQIWQQPSSLVKQLLLITATPFESATKNLVEDYGEIELLPVQEVTRDNYHRFSDSQHIDSTCIKSSSNVDYAAEVFDKFIPDGPSVGDVWFLPAEHKKDTHNEMQELLFGLGFTCVIKINGTNKEISILNDSNQEPLIIPFSDITKDLKGTDLENFAPSNNEISRWLGNYYSRNKGKERWIMGITGNICISRGISIQSPECLITHAIYGLHCATSNKNQYQIFARVCGNIREFLDTKRQVVQLYIVQRKTLMRHVVWNN